MEEIIKGITETIEGAPVKNLVWKPIDNIIVGQVFAPELAVTKAHEGFISGAWRSNGSPTNSIKGYKNLTLKLLVK